jgi:hypothetical protein
MDYSTVGLGAAVKAMNDVIIPATAESGNTHALEQAHLVRDVLSFTAERITLVHSRARYELKHFAKVADTLVSDQASRNLTSSTRLEEALRNAAATLNHTDASYSELRSSTEQLSLAVRSALDVDDLEAPVRSRLERLVLDAMDERLQIDRSWLLPLGFDPLPHTVAPIEAALS